MFNLDPITNKNNKDDDKKWPYRILIIGSSGSGKTNALLNLIQQDNDNLIDRIYLYDKDLSEDLSVFDDMIADVMTNKKFQAVIKELFIRCRKLNISLVFIRQSYFSVPKEVKLNSRHYLIMKIHNKTELQQLAINRSADIDFKDFLKIYRNCTKEPHFFFYY